MIHLKIVSNNGRGRLTSGFTICGQVVYTPKEWTVALQNGLFTLQGENIATALKDIGAYLFVGDYTPQIWMCQVAEPVKQLKYNLALHGFTGDQHKVITYKRVRLYQRIRPEKHGYAFRQGTEDGYWRLGAV